MTADFRQEARVKIIEFAIMERRENDLSSLEFWEQRMAKDSRNLWGNNFYAFRQELFDAIRSNSSPEPWDVESLMQAWTIIFEAQGECCHSPLPVYQLLYGAMKYIESQIESWIKDGSL